jgi:hypothetical protein
MTEKEARAASGLSKNGLESPVGGLARDAMTTLMGEAVKSTRPKKKDGKKRKRGGQPGNQNGVKKGIYSRLDQFEQRFVKYSKALGKASAQEEVALSRAMIMNVIDGKTPLGDGELDDQDVRAEYARDLILLNLKAQELALKQEAKRAEMEAKLQGDKGVTVMLSSEMEQAMGGMIGGQALVGGPAFEGERTAAATADEMLRLAKETLAASDRARDVEEETGGAP